MQYKTYSFEKLDVYQLARSFRKELNVLLKSFPKHEMYDLVSQIKRASGSVTTNIAEGSARATSKDKAYFTNISYGSCMELFDHINAALDLEYLNTVVYEDLRVKLDVIVAKLNNLYHYQINDEKDLKLKAKKL